MADDHPAGSTPGREGETAPQTQAAKALAGPAARALAEAEARRAERRRSETPRPREIDGRQGPEPVRYGDWENKGIASDF